MFSMHWFRTLSDIGFRLLPVNITFRPHSSHCIGTALHNKVKIWRERIVAPELYYFLIYVVCSHPTSSCGFQEARQSFVYNKCGFNFIQCYYKCIRNCTLCTIKSISSFNPQWPNEKSSNYSQMSTRSLDSAHLAYCWFLLMIWEVVFLTIIRLFSCKFYETAGVTRIQK